MLTKSQPKTKEKTIGIYDHKSLGGGGGGGSGARKMMRNALILSRSMIDDILMHKIKCGKIKSQHRIEYVTV